MRKLLILLLLFSACSRAPQLPTAFKKTFEGTVTKRSEGVPEQKDKMKATLERDWYRLTGTTLRGITEYQVKGEINENGYVKFKESFEGQELPDEWTGQILGNQLTITKPNGPAVWLAELKETSSVTSSPSEPPASKSSSGRLSTAKAQATLDRWIKTREGGTVVVIGVQETTQNQDQADIKVTNFQHKSWFGPRPFTGPGTATFKHYTDGRWVLTDVYFWQLDLLAHPNMTVE
ncbi:MAG TPA: hypothetical protein VE863_06710 [Pyrinomonadaceae bacterium]|nr:hypothetical protein [Pyrinomonadaceae bacterium]